MRRKRRSRASSIPLARARHASSIYFRPSMLHYSNSRYTGALARRLNLALLDLVLRPWSILFEGRKLAFSDCATPSCRCYRQSVNTPVTVQIPCFATKSAADVALRGPLAPTRPCCPARICPCSSDPTWVASLYAMSLHCAVVGGGQIGGGSLQYENYLD